MRSQAAIGIVAAALLVASAAPTAQAQGGSEPREAEARGLFDQAQAHFDAGRYALAAESFQRAYDIMHELGRPTAPLILFNVGSSLQRVPGREREARDAYARFLDEASEDDPAAREQMETVRARILELDARLRPTSPSDAPVEPGGRGGASISPVGPIVLGAGAAALIAGLILGGVALGQDGEIGAECPARTGCPGALRAQYEDAKTLALAGDALWISGAVIAATGLVLTVVLDGGGGDTASAALSCGGAGCRAELRGVF